MARRVTLKDVARAAGIAPATASHALNRNGTVSERTAARVQQVADELGYHRDQRAASLRRQRTSTIGLLIPRISDPFCGELAEAIEVVARERGYSLLGGTTNRDPQLEKHYLDLFLGRRCDGVIVIMGRKTPDPVIRAGVPTVLVNFHPAADLPDVPHVEVQDLQGMQSAVAHLIRLGHRRIALVTFPGVELRAQGYRRALADAGIPYDPDLEVSGGDVDARFMVYDHVQRLLQRRPDITAVAATTDMAAMGVIRAAHLLGKRVPDDLAVVGFDDISLAAAYVPALTTVAQPIHAIAASAMDLMVEQIEEGGVALDRRRILLETKLIVRESCGGNRPSEYAPLRHRE